MGSSRNLASFAKRLNERFPGWQVHMPDLSHTTPTITETAHEVLAWMHKNHIQPDMIIGHSYGGKVALALGEMMPLKQIWVWDAEPGFRNPGKTDEIITKLKTIGMPQLNRKAVQEAMHSLGLPRDIIAWMLMNLIDSSEGVSWRFNFNTVEAMLKSFRETAFTPRENTDFIKAERNSHMHLPIGPRVHLLENAGHWVHVDNPDGILDIMAHSLQV